jgi:hypothetical protein
MKNIYKHTPGTKHVSRAYKVAAILWLQLAYSTRNVTSNDKILYFYFTACGQGSSVGTATDYGLDGPRIESRWGEIFRRPDRTWCPPSLLYNGYRVFPGDRKRPGRDADPSPLLIPRSKNREQLYLYSP